MPTILALDTATADLAVAVRTDAACVSRSVPSGRRTGSLLTPTVAQVCEEAGVARADLDAIAVGVGPGPYTSLRAGLMFARTAGFALGIPVVGACTLDVIARGVPDEGVADRVDSGDSGDSGDSLGTPAARDVGVAPRAVADLGFDALTPAAAGEPALLVAIDARRREVYWAAYDGCGRRVTGPRAGPLEEVRSRWPQARLVQQPPDAGVLAAWVAQGMVAGRTAIDATGPGSAPGLALARVPTSWDAARADGAAAGWVPQALLEPEPVYLRRPDAVAPTIAGRS